MPRVLTGILHGIRGNRLSRQLAGKEPLVRTLRLPIRAQERQQRRREHDIAIFPTFALVHPNDHPLTINVGDLQMGRFGDA